MVHGFTEGKTQSVLPARIGLVLTLKRGVYTHDVFVKTFGRCILVAIIDDSLYICGLGCRFTQMVIRFISWSFVFRWLKELRDHADDRIVILVVGNKCDLR